MGHLPSKHRSFKYTSDYQMYYKYVYNFQCTDGALEIDPNTMNITLIYLKFLEISWLCPSKPWFSQSFSEWAVFAVFQDTGSARPASCRHRRCGPRWWPSHPSAALRRRGGNSAVGSPGPLLSVGLIIMCVQ
jgi:hypothetical protein